MDRELVAQVFKRLMVEIEKPTAETPALSEVDGELAAIDAFVDRLMASAIPSDPPTPKAIVPAYSSGTKPVSLRIPNRVLTAFRAESIKTGTNYQTLMIRELANAADGLSL